MIFCDTFIVSLNRNINVTYWLTKMLNLNMIFELHFQTLKSWRNVIFWLNLNVLRKYIVLWRDKCSTSAKLHVAWALGPLLGYLDHLTQVISSWKVAKSGTFGRFFPFSSRSLIWIYFLAQNKCFKPDVGFLMYPCWLMLLGPLLTYCCTAKYRFLRCYISFDTVTEVQPFVAFSYLSRISHAD